MFNNTTGNTSQNMLVDSEEPATPQDNKNDKPNNMESLLNISSSSNLSLPNNDMDNERVRRIVLKTMKQMQSVSQQQDLEELVDLVVPKVLFDLHSLDQLQNEVQTIKQTLDSYIQHSKVLGEDISEIFLDLHNIYSRLDRLDKCVVKTPRDTKFTKRLRESEAFLKNTKHYILNDKGHKAPCAMPDVATSSPKEIDEDKESVMSNETRNAERRAFLTNMLLVKKSDFSLQLNRNKNYYTEAERVLRQKESSNSDLQ